MRRRRRATLGRDEVVCRLCHKVYRAIRVSHLRAAHGLEGPHPVEDYKERFGLRVAACDEVCDTMRDLRTERAKRDGAHMTRAQVLAELRRRLRAGRSIAVSALGVRLDQTVRRRFGTWTHAVKKLGEDPIVHRLSRAWPRARVLREIRARAAKGAPLSMSGVVADCQVLYAAGRREFGSWALTLRAAGLDPDAHRVRRRLSMAELEAWIRARHARGGSLQIGDVPESIRRAVRGRHRGGWGAFVTSLGLPYPGILRRMDWTADAVLAEIRRRRRASRPLNLAAVQTEGQALLHQARNYFGSWDAALRAAGIEASTVRRQRAPWTRADVVEALRRRHRRGLGLTHRALKKEDPRLRKAVLGHLDTSLERALEKAGLDPALARRG